MADVEHTKSRRGGQNFRDLTKEPPFGRLTVRAFAGRRGKHSMWICDCVCGGEIIASSSNLVTGNTTSCGCHMRERIRETKTKHGHSPYHGKRSRTYNSWANMVRRCTDPTYPQYVDYGGRGITVCEPWRDFRNFLADMGECPPDMTIDRIDNDQGYTKDNCRWTTMRQQNRNRRSNHLVTFQGKTQTVMEWSEETGIPYQTLQSRMHNPKLTTEQALTMPVRRWPSHTSPELASEE